MTKDAFPLVKNLQRAHFQKMSPEERRLTILDAQRQMDYIAFSSTKAGEEKREELQQRIDFLKSLK